MHMDEAGGRLDAVEHDVIVALAGRDVMLGRVEAGARLLGAVVPVHLGVLLDGVRPAEDADAFAVGHAVGVLTAVRTVARAMGDLEGFGLWCELAADFLLGMGGQARSAGGLGRRDPDGWSRKLLEHAELIAEALADE